MQHRADSSPRNRSERRPCRRRPPRLASPLFFFSRRSLAILPSSPRSVPFPPGALDEALEVGGGRSGLAAQIEPQVVAPVELAPPRQAHRLGHHARDVLPRDRMVIGVFADDAVVPDDQRRVLPRHVRGKPARLDDGHRDPGGRQKGLGVELPVDDVPRPGRRRGGLGPHGAAEDHRQVAPGGRRHPESADGFHDAVELDGLLDGFVDFGAHADGHGEGGHAPVGHRAPEVGGAGHVPHVDALGFVAGRASEDRPGLVGVSDEGPNGLPSALELLVEEGAEPARGARHQDASLRRVGVRQQRLLPSRQRRRFEASQIAGVVATGHQKEQREQRDSRGPKNAAEPTRRSEFISLPQDATGFYSIVDALVVDVHVDAGIVAVASVLLGI
mmetsp:Transcript_24017/g.56689  ORF Transcript_24017/g.56689 Transcript_24017/m.56689 type:complete len:387 (+) Transcript_24017:198-1358(+)